MNKLISTRPRRIALLVAGAAAVALIPLAAIAANPTTHLTGCLNTTKGTIAKVKVGDAPMTACTSAETEMTVAGGDITAVLAGTGLTGGGTTGNATLGLAAGYALPQNCATAKVVKRSSTGWICATDNGGLVRTTAPITVDADSRTTCSSYPINLIDTKKTASFTLPLGTYSPMLAGKSRWWFDRMDGETTGGQVSARVVQVLNGATTVVSTFARAESSDTAGGGLPYNQDLTPFLAVPAASYYVEVEAYGKACSRARLLDGSVAFTQIG